MVAEPWPGGGGTEEPVGPLRTGVAFRLAGPGFADQTWDEAAPKQGSWQERLELRQRGRVGVQTGVGVTWLPAVPGGPQGRLERTPEPPVPGAKVLGSSEERPGPPSSSPGIPRIGN